MKRVLVNALKNKFSMMREDAKELAKIIENIFNGKEEVNDGDVDRHVRQLFCELQREKIVKVRRDEYKNRGKLVREYYWSLNYKVIKKEANRKPEKEDRNIYKKLPESVWSLHFYCS